ncbi:MAG: hypothetical protein IPM84_26140 [Anaerolineae bacterium]|nr:hypothetical protein [Anaerolineae bacterium]
MKEVWQAKTCDSANQADWARPALYSYDLYGNRTGETNAAGATATTAYDATFKTYPVTQTTTPGAGGGATRDDEQHLLRRDRRRSGRQRVGGAVAAQHRPQQRSDPSDV